MYVFFTCTIDFIFTDMNYILVIEHESAGQLEPE